MQFLIVFSVLLILGSPTFDCFLLGGYGNTNKPLIGTAKLEISSDGAAQKISFPEVSCGNLSPKNEFVNKISLMTQWKMKLID